MPPSSKSGACGYQGRWAWVNLTERTVRIEPADASVCDRYLGGRGVQARLIADHLARGPMLDPLSAVNRIVIGSGPLNDTPLATAGRGSCSFISPLTRSPGPAPWIPRHAPLHGLLTHSSAGGLFPDMLKRTGIDQLVIDGRADRPVRLFVSEEGIEIVDAEDALFENVPGNPRIVRGASATTDWLGAKYPGAATVAVGPAGWNGVAYACLTGDHHRNFGRGGSGAVFAAKNLTAITAYGRRPVRARDAAAFARLVEQLNEIVKARALDRERTTSFRPTTGTTWWLDRAFDGRYMGTTGGYLPWHNFDEGYFDPAVHAAVGTEAFLAISGKPKVCNRCRYVMCTRAAQVDSGPFAGDGVRPEFETVALWINCCIADREAIFHANARCNDLGVDTMTFGSVLAAAMEMTERAALGAVADAPRFGSVDDMLHTLNAIAYRSSDLGRALGEPADVMIANLSALAGGGSADEVAACVTTAFGGMGYAGIEPKVFPGMFAAYATSNRGRGDHTYAWTVQAEEGGLREPRQLAAYVAEGQRGKAVIDSLGLCDFFAADVASEPFLRMYEALTGRQYDADELMRCGQRIYALERSVNNWQGRSRAYDAYVHPKLAVPLTAGSHAGKSVDGGTHNAILDAYYAHNGWNADGVVEAARLKELANGG